MTTLIIIACVLGYLGLGAVFVRWWFAHLYAGPDGCGPGLLLMEDDAFEKTIGVGIYLLTIMFWLPVACLVFPVALLYEWLRAPMVADEQRHEQRKADYKSWLAVVRDTERPEADRNFAYEIAKTIRDLDPSVDRYGDLQSARNVANAKLADLEYRRAEMERQHRLADHIDAAKRRANRVM